MVGTKILVLDANEPFLKLFDLNGRVLQRFVRKGGGPGEIGAAQRFLFDSTSRRVYVWDTMRLRANVYLLGDTLRFDTSYRTPAVVADACFLGRRLFALAFWGGHLVHELEARSGELQVVRSLGVPRANHPLDGNPNFQFQVAMGRIACDAAHQQVVVVSSHVCGAGDRCPHWGSTNDKARRPATAHVPRAEDGTAGRHHAVRGGPTD